MKSLMLILLIVVSVSCVKKETTETINYNSEIFSGMDTLIYGKWEYLYTYSGDYVFLKSDLKLPSLNFTQIGNYEKLQGGNILEKGKILIHSNSGNNKVLERFTNFSVQFCPNGINNSKAYEQSLALSTSDTLIVSSGWWSTSYFKRIN